MIHSGVPQAFFTALFSGYVYLTEFSGYTVSMFKPDDVDWTTTTVKVTDNFKLFVR